MGDATAGDTSGGGDDGDDNSGAAGVGNDGSDGGAPSDDGSVAGGVGVGVDQGVGGAPATPSGSPNDDTSDGSPTEGDEDISDPVFGTPASMGPVEEGRNGVDATVGPEVFGPANELGPVSPDSRDQYEQAFEEFTQGMLLNQAIEAIVQAYNQGYDHTQAENALPQSMVDQSAKDLAQLQQDYQSGARGALPSMTDFGPLFDMFSEPPELQEEPTPIPPSTSPFSPYQQDI